MTTIAASAAALAEATRGINWSAETVGALVKQILAASRRASKSELDGALAVLVARLRDARLADADGVAHVAITGGSLVEAGASPRPLGEVLLDRMPDVLEAARRFATTLLAAFPEPQDDEEVDDPLVEVDQRAVPREVFVENLPNDREGGTALSHLSQWCLPSIAAWSRDREVLLRAKRDPRLVASARSMCDSDAYFVGVLLGAALDELWTVLLPVVGRGFDVRVDGLVRNFDLHLLLAEALATKGVPVAKNDRAVIANLRKDDAAPKGASVRGSFNLYSWQAAGFDLADGGRVPHDVWVWGEGAPRDVPLFDGVRTLLIGPASMQRGWNAGRTFARLFADVSIQREWSRDEVQTALGRLRDAVAAGARSYGSGSGIGGAGPR